MFYCLSLIFVQYLYFIETKRKYINPLQYKNATFQNPRSGADKKKLRFFLTKGKVYR